MTTQYIMKAYNNVAPVGNVYWAVLGTPDYTGAQSGYNPADLASITVDYSFPVPINGEGGINPTGLVGGDLTGTLPNPNIAQLQGIPVNASSPSNGESFVYNGSSWAPGVSKIQQFITNVSSLRNTASVISSSAIFLAGYQSVGDGGQGIFIWNSSDTRADDGGTIFAVSGVSTGRWNRILTDQWLNGQWFGMQATGRVSQGGFDNTAAMTNLINAANNQNKHIYIPPGFQSAQYGFAASAAATDPLPMLTGTTALIGGTEEVQTVLAFDNTDGSCLRFRGCNNCKGIVVMNFRTATLTNNSAAIHVANSAYGRYVSNGAFQGAINNNAMLLEQRYDLATITAVSGAGISPIQITANISSWNGEQIQHAKFQTGEQILIDGVVGNTAANGTWTITVISATSSQIVFTLNGSTGNGNYTSGGTAIRATDPYLLVHIGTWYNRIEDLQVTYLSVGGNDGYGLSLAVNPTCLNVVNPPGQSTGTFSGQVSYNRIFGVNIEGQQRGINLNNAASNTFVGGQLLGNYDQIYQRTSSGNTFLGLKHNQWTNSAYNSDNTCTDNMYISLVFFNVTSQPWQIGPDSTFTNTWGGSATTMLTSDGISWDGIYSRGGFYQAAGAQGIYAQTYAGAAPVWNISTSNVANWSIGPRVDNTGIAALYAMPDSVNPTGQNAVLSAVPNSFTKLACSGTSGEVQIGFSDGYNVRQYNTPVGVFSNQQGICQTTPVVFTTTDSSTHTVYTFTTNNGIAGSLTYVEVKWTARDNSNLASGSGGGLFSGLFANNGGGSMSAIGAPASIKNYGVNSVNVITGGVGSGQILVQVTSTSTDTVQWQLEIYVNES